MAPPSVRAVIAVPAALGMKNEQKRVRGIVNDSPIVATVPISLISVITYLCSLPAGVVLSIAVKTSVSGTVHIGHGDVPLDIPIM